jgi:hypothetical protein
MTADINNEKRLVRKIFADHFRDALGVDGSDHHLNHHTP